MVTYPAKSGLGQSSDEKSAKRDGNISSRIYQMMMCHPTFSSNSSPKGVDGGRRCPLPLPHALLMLVMRTLDRLPETQQQDFMLYNLRTARSKMNNSS